MKKCPLCNVFYSFEDPLDGQETEECPNCKSLIDTQKPGWLDKIANTIVARLKDDSDTVRDWVDERRNRGKNSREIAELAIRNARFWSGNVGFVAGLGDYLGPWGFGAGTAGDIGYAAKLSVRMSQRIYCAFGYNIDDEEVQFQIISSLGAGAAGLGKVTRVATNRIGKRLLEKYLKGALLKAVKDFLRKLGVIFTRKAIVAWLPVVGSGVNLVVNRNLMGLLGRAILSEIEQ